MARTASMQPVVVMMHMHALPNASSNRTHIDMVLQNEHPLRKFLAVYTPACSYYTTGPVSSPRGDVQEVSQADRCFRAKKKHLASCWRYSYNRRWVLAYGIMFISQRDPTSQSVYPVLQSVYPCFTLYHILCQTYSIQNSRYVFWHWSHLIQVQEIYSVKIRVTLCKCVYIKEISCTCRKNL